MENEVQTEIFNQGGSVQSMLLANSMNPLALRPFVGEDGRHYIMNSDGKSRRPIYNANATLRKDEWIQVDRAVAEAKQQRLGAVTDLESNGLVYNLNTGMSKSILQYQNQSDITEAKIGMDAIAPAQRDRVQYDLTGLPIPIIYKECSFTMRELVTSRNEGTPLSTTNISLATRKIMEYLEQLVLGTTSFTYAGSTIYGYMNFPSRITSTTMTAWDASAKTMAGRLADIQNMKQASIDARHFGPWMLYIPSNYETYLDQDYTTNYPITLRERILKIENIKGIRVTDFLTDDNILLVQMQNDVVDLVKAMPITTMQWESRGGLELNFMVMTMQTPRLRADYNSRTGIVHYSTS